MKDGGHLNLTDGRNIDSTPGTLSGEGSQQLVRGTRAPPAAPFDNSLPRPGEATYYDQPVIKKSVWSWSIPAYYYVGGLSVGSAVLGAAATMLDPRHMPPSRSPGLRRCAGVLGSAGALCLRFGIHYAGQRSAMDPRATFQQQRQGEGAFASVGQSAIVEPGGQRACAPATEPPSE